MCYILMGALLLTITCCIFGILFTYWVSIILGLIYFIGLVFVIKITSKNSKKVEKSLHINLSICLINYSREILKPMHNLEARIGYLSQWVEFHSIKIILSNLSFILRWIHLCQLSFFSFLFHQSSCEKIGHLLFIEWCVLVVKYFAYEVRLWINNKVLFVNKASCRQGSLIMTK